MSKTVEQATAALAAANAAFLSELERDSERGEGSTNQERRREEHQRSLRDDIAQCERDLEEAKRVAKAAVPELTVQQMQDRIKVLAGEMDANDEENRAMQSEIDTLYAKIDAASSSTT